MVKGFLKSLLKSNKTVFSVKELCLLWSDADPKTIKSRLHYYVKKGDLYHIRRGFYALDRNYNRLELATKIFTPSYISFETVLRAAGIIFQHYESIFVASYQSKTIECDDQTYIFKTIKPTILTNPDGIEIKENYSIASPERAFLDTIYLNINYHFDNLEPLNWEKINQILPLYGGNERVGKMVEIYHRSIESAGRAR
jgi:predicted transcriptional regulator of viral defense system